MHLGAHMNGGEIDVTGNASDWIGAEMTNGLIRVAGNAYRGSLAGMKGGTILICGTAGLEVGMRMKRGIIVVGGPVRDFAGLQATALSWERAKSWFGSPAILESCVFPSSRDQSKSSFSTFLSDVEERSPTQEQAWRTYDTKS